MTQKTQLNPSTSQTPETRYVDTHRVSCNGGGGALGHPLVWYSLDDGDAQCGYCGVKFIYRTGSSDQH